MSAKFFFLGLGFLLLAGLASACNEAVCASIVSKCTLLKSCECKIEPGVPCTCCDRCTKCLDYLLTECCSCFELCPKPNVTEMTQESTVFDYKEPVPELWNALTDRDYSDQWDKFVYPVDIPPNRAYKSRDDGLEQLSQEELGLTSHTKPDLLIKGDTVTVNCTVVYLSQCISANKCKSSCSTMGATSGRWFEDGCCECIGHHCTNYGINESRCSLCGGDGDGGGDEEDLEEMSEEELEQLDQQYEEELYTDD